MQGGLGSTQLLTQAWFISDPWSQNRMSCYPDDILDDAKCAKAHSVTCNFIKSTRLQTCLCKWVPQIITLSKAFIILELHSKFLTPEVRLIALMCKVRFILWMIIWAKVGPFLSPCRLGRTKNRASLYFVLVTQQDWWVHRARLCVVWRDFIPCQTLLLGVSSSLFVPFLFARGRFCCCKAQLNSITARQLYAWDKSTGS